MGAYGLGTLNPSAPSILSSHAVTSALHVHSWHCVSCAVIGSCVRRAGRGPSGYKSPFNIAQTASFPSSPNIRQALSRSNRSLHSELVALAAAAVDARRAVHSCRHCYIAVVGCRGHLLAVDDDARTGTTQLWCVVPNSRLSTHSGDAPTWRAQSVLVHTVL